MNDMEVDDIVEEKPANETEIAVYSGNSSSQERPRRLFVFRHRRVRMMQKRDSDCTVSVTCQPGSFISNFLLTDPMVDPEPWDNVEEKHRTEAQ